jgi:hypothetical protein
MNEIEIKALWKQTNQEPLGLTIEALHQKSLAFHRKVWRQDIAELMGWAIVTLVFGFQIGAAPNALTRSGELLAIASAIIAAFHLRRYATTRPSDASTGSSLLTFHISELHRRRDLLRSVWRWIVDRRADDDFTLGYSGGVRSGEARERWDAADVRLRHDGHRTSAHPRQRTRGSPAAARYRCAAPAWHLFAEFQ